MLANSEIPAAENAAEIMGQLAKVLASSGFTRSGRMQQFLKFIVVNALEGQHETLKEAYIGAAVFDRSPGYDPKLDPIVRVEARRLRTKLESYYETEGRHDSLIIRLPKGGYLPVFEAAPDPLQALEAQTQAPIELSDTPQDHIAPPLLEEATPVPVPSPTPVSSRKYLPTAIVVSAILLVAGVVGLITYRFSHRPKSTTFLPLTNLFGQELQPSLSPDGRYLAFVWNGNGNNYDIYIKDLKTSEVKRLTTSQAHDLHPAWSPDGRDLAFLRMSTDRSEIMIMPALGGQERSVGEVRNAVNVWKADASQIAQSLGPAWSSDGRSLIVTNEPGKAETNGLYSWPLGYGDRQQLTKAPLGNDDFDPSVSPNGKDVAFVRQTSNSSDDVFLLSLQDGQIRQLTFDRRGVRGLTWSNDSRSILFSSNRGGVYNLWRIAADGGHPTAITTNYTEATDPSVAKNDVLVFTDTIQNTNVWRYDLLAGHEDPANLPLISSSRKSDSPQYSPDGKKVVFVSDRSGHWELWEGNAEGTNLRQLTSFGGPMLGTPHWSPDGRTIAFDARPYGHSAIYTIDAGGNQPKLLESNSFEERMPNWSRDGEWIYFNSTRGGKIQLWKRHLSDGKLYPLTQRPAYDSFESPDGQSIYFLSDGRGIWRVSSDGTGESLLPELRDVNSSRYLAVVGDHLYFVANETTPSVVQRFDLRTHHLQRVATIDRQLVDNTPGLSVSADERWMLYARSDGSNSDVMSLQPE